jgi:hypothetical protein
MNNTMSTKFVSKNSNYMLVLKPGVEGNRALGTHAVSGIYVRFQDGAVDVKDQNIIDMLKGHPGFGNDFVEVKPEDVDPYADAREEIEPAHIVTEMKYGHAERVVGTPKPVKVTPQMKKLLEKEALKMLPGLLKSNPGLLKDLVVGLATEMKAKEDAKTEVKAPEEAKAEEEVA